MIIGYYNNCLKDIVLIVIYYLLYNSGIACSKTIIIIYEPNVQFVLLVLNINIMVKNYVRFR